MTMMLTTRINPLTAPDTTSHLALVSCLATLTISVRVSMSADPATALRTRLRDQLHKRKAVITDEEVELLARENAAIKIQRAWRTKKRAAYLGPDFLWTDLATHARFQVRGRETTATYVTYAKHTLTYCRWIVTLRQTVARTRHATDGGALSSSHCVCRMAIPCWSMTVSSMRTLRENI